MPTTERCIGRYVLLEPVGRGAMGVVYRAEDPSIHRTVAVKVLRLAEGLTKQQVAIARERFTREARAAGSIDHPNVTRILDVGETKETGEPYIVMEYVAASSLEGLLNEGNLELDRALEIIGQIASGLDAAHARGIIHRDIKPSNILLTEDGTPKIADFGITHIESSCLTQDMRELGSPAYMSPEQVASHAVDSRSDLFALGVLSYELLTGRKPFEGADAVSMAYAIVHALPVPISEANPALPYALDCVMDRILAKDPAERFATGREFHQACLECLPDRGARPPSPRVTLSKRLRNALLGLAGVAALAVVVSLPSMGRRATPPPLDDPAPSRPAPAASEAAPPKARPPASAVRRAKPTPPPHPTPTKPTVNLKSAAPVAAAPVAAKAPDRAPLADAASAAQRVPTANVTISLGHRLRQGTLVVSLDGVVVFNETFAKSKLVLFQTTTWDPMNAPAGGHELSASVTGADGKVYLSNARTVEFPRGKAVVLRFGIKGDTLTVKQSSG